MNVKPPRTHVMLPMVDVTIALEATRVPVTLATHLIQTEGLARVSMIFHFGLFVGLISAAVVVLMLHISGIKYK